MSASESKSGIVLELAEEFLERYRQGQRPSLKEYIDRHPELADEIKEVFPAMALMENIALADESLAEDATGPARQSGQAPPEHLGDYRILREVGRGGMGIVYEADQVSLGRHVALKVLPRKVLLDATQKRRFEREAKAAAKLHHTNIVPVFGVGEHEGLPYYVMQFIQGLGLDDVLDELRRLQDKSNVPSVNAPRCAARPDVSAADLAHSLMTGTVEYRAGSVGSPSESQGADAPRSEENVSATGNFSDSFALSSSTLKLPSGGGKAKKATYWQSVAQMGAQVADALEYAHKQGIQHRDIKPSNLLLDTRGTVWVTDFGLARADNEAHLTQTGDIVGTLRYLPPEAFEGRADKRGDIYSLGLTLYEMLARKPAFEDRDRHRLIKRVTTEEPARLNKLNRTIPRDLVTIVHKAIDREPSRRYQSAAELTADLQRFLDDEPIQARRISNGERLARWCRHHPGVATLTTALVLLLVGVTVASLFAAARFDRLAREQTNAAANERQARQAADEAKTQAEINLDEAERQRQRAEANFAKARKAVDDYFTAVSENQLMKVAGMQPLRRELLHSGLAFYQEFVKERGDDPTLRGELAAALLRVGKIRHELGEADAQRQAYEQARDLYEDLLRTSPQSVEWRHGLAESYYWLNRYEEAIALWEKLIQPGNPRFQRELAHAYDLRAGQYLKVGKFDKALEVRQQILTIREMLLRANPDDAESQRNMGGALYNLANLLSRNGRYAEALVLDRRAAAHAETAFARAPQMIENGNFLSSCQMWIGFLEGHFGHHKETLTALQRSLEVSRKLARDNPAIPSLQSKLFQSYSYLAWYQRDRNQTEQAERNMRLAREVGERLPSDSAVDLYNLACFHALCAISFRVGNEKPTAEEFAEQKREADLAIETLRKAIAAGYKDLDHIRRDPDLIALRGRADYKALEADLSAETVAAPDRLKAGQEALDLRQKLAKDDPKSRQLQADLAASQHALALIQFDLGKPDEARKQLQQAIAGREALLKQEPNNAQYQGDLAGSRFALGDFYWQSGQLVEAVTTWQREQNVLETAARQGSERSSLMRQLSVMRRTLGEHYARVGLFAEAAGHYDWLLQQEGASETDFFDAACLALRIGDVAAYRRHCQAMVQRLGKTPSKTGGRMLSWTGLLADNSGVETAPYLQQASNSMDKNTALDRWGSHVLGMSHYRAGRYEEAIEQAKQSTAPNPSWRSKHMNWPLLAMAHHRLGHAEEARKWLDRALEEWRRLSPLPRSPGDLQILPSPADVWHKYWHDWLTFEILLREATVLITGKPPVDEVYDHVHRSLLHNLLGEKDKAEAEWQTALKIAPREPAIWLARGRLFAQRGQQDKADADFAQATVLAPEELDRFPQAGWWVVGPYPEDLALSCPPEKNPDPSHPVAAVDSDKQLSWRPAPTDADGRVRLWEMFRATHISAYALTYVYSPKERTASLMVGGDDRVRVWLNGRQVHERNRLLEAPWELDFVPVTLKAGRNVLLCKVSQDIQTHFLYLRIADNPADRAILAARLGLWEEAAPLFERGVERHQSIELDGRCTQAHLLVGDTAAYRRDVERMFARYDENINGPAWLAYMGTLQEGAVKPARLVELAERGLDRENRPFMFQAAGLAHYRAGAYQRAIERFEESLKDPRWKVAGGHASEFGLALAHHRLGHAKEAQQWFDKAEQWYDKALDAALASPQGLATLYNWADWPSFLILRREAHKVILGTELPDDPRQKQLADRMRDWLKKRDPATVDYDVALRLYSWQPRMYLARGRRLTELKRYKEAEADLNFAVQRQADDPEAWKERGRLYFHMGQTDKADADFRKAIKLLGDKASPSEPAPSAADELFNEIVDKLHLQKLTGVIQSDPDDMERRWERGEWYAQHRRWKEAAGDFKLALQREPPAKVLQWLHAAPVFLAADDREGYLWLCREARKRFGDSQDAKIGNQLAKIHLLLPDGDKEVQWAGELADRAVSTEIDDAWLPYRLLDKCLADYRRGNFDAAAKNLDALLLRIASRQGLDAVSLRVVSRNDLTAACRLLLAMSLHKQGQTRAAKKHFERSSNILKQYVFAPARFPTENAQQYSHDWLIVWLLHREAQTPIEGKK